MVAGAAMAAASAPRRPRSARTLWNLLHVGGVKSEVADEQKDDERVHRRRQHAPPASILARDRKSRRR
jgi:hypothetical protein